MGNPLTVFCSAHEKSRIAGIVTAVLIAVACVRVASTYRVTAQGFDEPCHIAAAIELLDRHTYTLDPVHPPLSRLAIGIPLYLTGKRFPHLTAEEAAKPNYNVVGNHILYDDGHYLRNLVLGRCSMLLFLATLAMLVFFWTRREVGNQGALISVLVLTTTPIVLALSGLAYTDMVTATTQFAAIFAFTNWLSNPGRRSILLLGAAIGLALMSKLTSLLFLPAASVAILVVRWWLSRTLPSGVPKVNWKGLVAAFAIGAIVLWGGYGFSVGHISQEMGISRTTLPSFQHFPGPLRHFSRTVALWDPLVPAPAFFRGLATAWVLNKASPPAYLLGHIRPGGWWYFFIVGIAFKTPIPILLLSGVGLLSLTISVRHKSWEHLAPAVSVLAILLVTMPVKYNAGLRHVLVVFPLLAMIAGQGFAYLWREIPARNYLRFALIALLLWQGVETLGSRRDFIAYFNEFAGKDPSRVMVAGCDLDCGQDIFRLSRELAARGVSHFDLAVWSSADMQKMGLPDFEVLQPFRPVTGWVAVSARSLRFGDVLHTTYPPDAFAWLNDYRPVAKIGNTIWLYHIGAEQSATVFQIGEHRFTRAVPQ
jgi:hypothetical protein